MPHGTAEHVIGKPHGEPGAPHGAGSRGDMAEENKPVEGEGAEPHGEENGFGALTNWLVVKPLVVCRGGSSGILPIMRQT